MGGRGGDHGGMGMVGATRVAGLSYQVDFLHIRTRFYLTKICQGVNHRRINNHFFSVSPKSTGIDCVLPALLCQVMGTNLSPQGLITVGLPGGSDGLESA